MKHHGLGNDFLVLLDPTGDLLPSPELARAVCARHTGVGADGLLHARRGDEVDADAVMILFNADGSRAEMSGNGIRCLAQALLLAGWATPPDVTITTDAGVRTVSLRDQPDADTHVLAVDMGAAKLGGEIAGWSGGGLRRAAWADMGNPHLVVEVDSPAVVAEFDLVTLGEKANAAMPEGANVHLVAAEPATDTLTVRTYERGVGLTQACGTGACASAAVAHDWGLVGPNVTVQMPGGVAEVRLGDTVELTGPAVAIATIEWPCR
jgi:diaminopimelate epimerase